MSQERLMWQGQKQEMVLEKQGLETASAGLLHGLRMILNPHVPLSEINTDLLSQQAFDLCNKITTVKELEAKIANINKSLGIKE